MVSFTNFAMFVQVDMIRINAIVNGDVVIDIELGELTGGHLEHVLLELVLDLIALAVCLRNTTDFDALEAHARSQACIPST